MDKKSRLAELESRLSLTYDIMEAARIQGEMARLVRGVSKADEDWEDVPGTGRLYQLSSRGRLKNRYTGEVKDVKVDEWGEKIYMVRDRHGKIINIRWEGEVNVG